MKKMTKLLCSILLVSSLSRSITASEDNGGGGVHTREKLVSLPRLKALQEEDNTPVVRGGHNSSQPCGGFNNNETCPNLDNPILRLLRMRSADERSKHIEEHGIGVEHTFLNVDSERFLYIENYHSTSRFLVGEVGAADASTARNVNYNEENSFLTLRQNDCPEEDPVPCYTIENGNGQLYAIKYKDNPYMLAFDHHEHDEHQTTDAMEEGIVVFDATRFENVYNSGLWVLEKHHTDDSSSSSSDNAVSIRNVGTGRRLFAREGYDKKEKFGGTPGTNEDPIDDDQLWRHCVRYSYGEETTLDCSRYI